MTDEISLVKARTILLPIILGLVIIFFLKLFSIKVSLLIWIVLLIAIFFISLLLTIRSKLSLTSKLPNFKTILPGLFWLAVIVFVLLFVWECLSYVGCLGPEKFSDDTTMKDYEYKGNFVIQDESLKICGTATVLNSDASDNFFFLPLYWESPDFDIFGTGKGTIRITMDNSIQRYEKEISVNDPFRIKVGTGASWQREDVVYFIANDISLTNDAPPIYFDTDRPYSVKVDFTGTFNVFEINLGE